MYEAKLGSREIYQPIQYCWVHTCRLLGYLVHTCHLPIDIQQVSCSTPDRAAFALAVLMLPCLGYLLQLIHRSLSSVVHKKPRGGELNPNEHVSSLLVHKAAEG